jgi:hypothetical protein
VQLATAMREESQSGRLCRERFVDGDPFGLILIWDAPLFGHGEEGEAHVEERLVARSEFFRTELRKWEGSAMKRIFVPFDSGQTLIPLLLGELIPRFTHGPEFAGQRLMEIARTPDKLISLCVVASYYGLTLRVPTTTGFSSCRG